MIDNKGRVHRRNFEISDTRYLSIEEAAGVNWRDNLDEIEDEWESMKKPRV